MNGLNFTPNRTVNRFPPKLPSRAYRTHRVVSPLSTHYRLATCAEVECRFYTQGATYKKADLERENLLYLVTHAGRRWREMELTEGGEKYIVFEPGQVCFQANTHRVSLERPEFFYTGRGDYRTFSLRRATQMKPDDWADHLLNHMESLKRARQEG